MSPSGTMLRVYAELKRRIMAGDLRPGERLDPRRLGHEIMVSMTPIRESLHQLRGEGLVENWQHEGFWIAQLSEIVIRDRYLWCRDLVDLCLKSATAHPSPAKAPNGNSYADIVTYMMLRIAASSVSREHMRAMASICDRTLLLRLTEFACLDDPHQDLSPLVAAVEDQDWERCRAAYQIFHDRRMAIVPQIAAALHAR